MNTKARLLVGAAGGALIALGPLASAQARPAHHHHHAARRRAPASPALAEEVRELREEVRSLQARLDSQQASQQQTQQQTQAQVQEQVQTATAQAVQAAQAQSTAQIQELQQQLADVNQAQAEQTAEIKANKAAALPGWLGNTTLSSRMYFDLTGIEQKNNGVRVSPSGSAFDIKRLYIGIDHKFNDTYSANVTTDFQYSSSLGATELYIKKAYLQAKYFPWLTFRLGSADMPWIPFVEDIYGYRFVENTLIDRTKFGTSADWGVHALGSFEPIGGPTGPVVSYQVSVVNGTGYKAPPGTGNAPRTDTLDVEGRVSARWHDVTLALGGYQGRLGKNAGTVFNAPAGILTYRDANRFDALLAYNAGPIRAGVEYFNATNWTAVTNARTGDKAVGYSLFGSYQFTPMWSVFGRYDWVKPNKTTAPTKKDNYFNVGLDYEPVKIVDLSLVYKRDSVDNGLFSTSNGTIGGTREGTYDEFGLFGQFRW